MVFPQTQLPVRVEFNLGGWIDVTSYVREAPGIGISRGRQDESSQTERTQATFTLDNTDGRFSERNPTGPYYGLLSLNTPCRISVTRDTKVMGLPGGLVDYASTPDAAVLDITGDIDIRVDAFAHDWRTNTVLAAKWRTTSNQRSWAFYVEDGFLKLGWTTGGSTATRVTVASTSELPTTTGRLAVRVTLDVNNGASGNTATFYTSDTITGSWTQLGSAVVTSGTTSIHSGTAALETGGYGDATSDLYGSVYGWLYGFQLRSGIGGTLVANPDFTAQSVGATSFADTTSSPRTWTLTSGASLTDRWWRFHGEVSSWPQTWDITGQTVTVAVVAAGPLRRIGQGPTPLKSVMHRTKTTLADTPPLVYWPCEDAAGATQVASGLSAGSPMSISGGAPTFAADEGFACSMPLPTLNSAGLTGAVPAYAPTEYTSFQFLMYIPEAGLGLETEIARLTTTSAEVQAWAVEYDDNVAGTINLQGYAPNGASTLLVTAATAVNGKRVLVSLVLWQFGVNTIDYTLSVHEVGSNTSQLGTGQETGTYGIASQVMIGRGQDIVDMVVGHISVHSIEADDTAIREQVTGYSGEAAGERISRLCDEEGITFRCIGDLTDTVLMGAQQSLTLMDLLKDCANTDLGMLIEPLDATGLGYRTRRSLENQTAAVAVDYSAEELASSPVPTGDDQSVRNDVTVNRAGGSSARIELTTGRMSTASPPAGVGRYSASETVNVQIDSQLPDQANFRVYLGTIDEERYPQVHLSRTTPAVASNAALNLELLSLNVGGLLTIDNLPSPFVAPGQVRQLVQGWTETLGAYTHSFMFNTTPASAWDFGLIGDAVLGRLDTAGSSLASSATSSTTTLSVSTTSGPIWTYSAEEFPFDVVVGGEQITVDFVGSVLNANPSFETNTTGWAPQSATLTRSSTVAKKGTWSALLTSTAGSSPRIEASLVAASAGAVYRAVGWLYAPTTLPVQAGLNVNWFNGSSVYLSTSSNNQTLTAGVWTLLDTTFTAPANTAFASLVFALSGTPGAGVLLYGDELRLVPQTSYNTSPQTFTVVRSVNSVVKAHSSGADVRLAHPLIFSM